MLDWLRQTVETMGNYCWRTPQPPQLTPRRPEASTSENFSPTMHGKQAKRTREFISLETSSSSPAKKMRSERLELGTGPTSTPPPIHVSSPTPTCRNPRDLETPQQDSRQSRAIRKTGPRQHKLKHLPWDRLMKQSPRAIQHVLKFLEANESRVAYKEFVQMAVSNYQGTKPILSFGSWDGECDNTGELEEIMDLLGVRQLTPSKFPAFCEHQKSDEASLPDEQSHQEKEQDDEGHESEETEEGDEVDDVQVELDEEDVSGEEDSYHVSVDHSSSIESESSATGSVVGDDCFQQDHAQANEVLSHEDGTISDMLTSNPERDFCIQVMEDEREDGSDESSEDLSLVNIFASRETSSSNAHKRLGKRVEMESLRRNCSTTPYEEAVWWFATKHVQLNPYTQRLALKFRDKMLPKEEFLQTFSVDQLGMACFLVQERITRLLRSEDPEEDGPNLQCNQCQRIGARDCAAGSCMRCCSLNSCEKHKSKTKSKLPKRYLRTRNFTRRPTRTCRQQTSRR